jgi:serine-type D-Ala-D-Ala carboxypeptidase/endopeptidase
LLAGRPAPPSVTVGSLVEHTAGLPRVLPSQAHAVGDPYTAWTADRVDREVLPELGRLIEESGGRDVDVGYSNLGYAVLTRVVELRTGRPWIELLRERVVTPLGVAAEAVTLDPTGRPVVLSRSVLGRPQPDWNASTGPFSAAGGLYATLPDMLTLLFSAVDGRGELDPRRSPHAWDGRDPRYFHQGAHMRSGSVVVATSTRAGSPWPTLSAGYRDAAHTTPNKPSRTSHIGHRLRAILIRRSRRWCAISSIIWRVWSG